jgi:hypothetical protein
LDASADERAALLAASARALALVSDWVDSLTLHLRVRDGPTSASRARGRTVCAALAGLAPAS